MIGLNRRGVLLAGLGAPLLAGTPGLAATLNASTTDDDRMAPRPLVFPQDHGAHPAQHIEWWYLTGWLGASSAADASLGFQVTFFRARGTDDPGNPSAFAARQLVIAHAAIADPARGALLHDQRVAREGFGIAYARQGDTDVSVDRWTLKRFGERYMAQIPANGFSLQLTATPTQALLLQGQAGWSRKGLAADQASFYYSQPHLEVAATLMRDGRSQSLRGSAWLDHEWSSRFLAPQAAGWDWVGMNLQDGGALTAFRIRERGKGIGGDAHASPNNAKQASAPPTLGDRGGRGDSALFAYASLRNADGRLQIFNADQVRFETLREWMSPRTRGRYPVAQRIVVGDRSFETVPLMDDQELDSRASTGAVYWEGASRVLEAGRPAGRGYLEMTGYVAPLRL